MIKSQRIHQPPLKVKLPTFTNGELPTFTECREKESSTFTDDELPTFTEGRRKRNIIASSFTGDELPMFTEGRKKITITNFL